jgi:hypothetical protein
MARGKTNQPLLIWVSHQWFDTPHVAKLIEGGHSVYDMEEGCTEANAPPDLILHPAAHYWDDFMMVEETRKNGTKYQPYLDAAIAAARKRKKAKG